MADDRRTTGTAIIEALAANGIDTVFGIPGTHNIEFYRGLRRTPQIRHVLTRHEQGAAYAADGYARSTGRVAVVLTTSGPGLTNALTGIANAYADSIPMLVISPGVAVGEERLDAGLLHEMKDQRAAADAVAGRSIRPSSPRTAVDAVHEVIARWKMERPRPVHIEIPLDVLEADFDGAVGDPLAAPLARGLGASALETLVSLVSGSRVTIVAGGGAADSAASLTALAIALDAPVVTTVAAKGILDEDHPLSVGAASGSAALRPLLASTDVLLAVGTEFDDPAVYRDFAGPIIRVDIDPAQLHKNVRAAVPVLADADAFARELAAALPAGRALADGRERATAARAAVAATMSGSTMARWRPLQEALRAALPTDTIVAGDSSRVSYLGTGPQWRFTLPRRFLMTVGFATLGYALPAAIGAKIAAPGTPVIALLGDGALMFSVQELMTAAEQSLSIPVIVVDNHGFGEIKQNMIDAGVEPMGVEFARPDIVALAEAMGCHGHRALDAGHAASLAAEALTADRPTVIVLDVGPDDAGDQPRETETPIIRTEMETR